MGFAQVVENVIPKRSRYRVSMTRAMILIALIAVVLGFVHWMIESDPEAPLRHAWNDPITIRTTPDEDLETVLKRLAVAIRRPRLKYGPRIVVDPGGLAEAGRSLNAPIGTSYHVKNMPAHEFLEMVLKPLGLACQLQDRMVMVTSARSPNEPLDYGYHGEILCGHNAGPWLVIQRGMTSVGPTYR